MGLFNKFWKRGNYGPSEIISAADLESAILSAYEKIEAKKEAKLKADDALMTGPKTILLVSYFLLAAFCVISFILFTLSLFPGLSISSLRTLYTFHIFKKIFVLVASFGYAILFAYAFLAVLRERDRSVLISYFSAITSVVALIVAYIK